MVKTLTPIRLKASEREANHLRRKRSIQPRHWRCGPRTRRQPRRRIIRKCPTKGMKKPSTWPHKKCSHLSMFLIVTTHSRRPLLPQHSPTSPTRWHLRDSSFAVKVPRPTSSAWRAMVSHCTRQAPASYAKTPVVVWFNHPPSRASSASLAATIPLLPTKASIPAVISATLTCAIAVSLVPSMVMFSLRPMSYHRKTRSSGSNYRQMRTTLMARPRTRLRCSNFWPRACPTVASINQNKSSRTNKIQASLKPSAPGAVGS